MEQLDAAMSERLPRRAPFKAWWALAVLFLLYVMAQMDRLIITIVATDVQASLKLSDTQMGFALGPAFAVFYAVFGIPLGWATDRFPRRRLIFIGAFIFGMATVMQGLSTGFSWLVAACVLVGVGEASLSPAAYSLMADIFPRNLLTTASSIYNTAAKVGTSATYLIGGIAVYFAAHMTLLAPSYGRMEAWRIMFVMTGIISVFFSILVFTFAEPRRKQSASAESYQQPILPFLREHASLIVPMLIGFALMGVCTYSMNAWVPTFLTRRFGMKPIEYGPILGAISAAAAVVLVLKGIFVDWLYTSGMKDAHIRFYTWLLAIAIPVAFVIFRTGSPIVFIAGYSVVQVICIPAVAYIAATLQIIVPGHLRGQVFALFLFVLTVAGGGIGPLLVGVITQHGFADASRVGASLAIVVCTVLPLAFISFRWSLPSLRHFVARAEAAAEAV